MLSTSNRPCSEGLDYAGLPVLHLFHQFHTLGGVESILRVHYDCDSSVGVKSDLIIYLEDPSASRERLHCLGLRTTEPMRSISRKLDQITTQLADRTAIYHLTFGARFLCPYDHSRRRIFVAHGKDPVITTFLKRHLRFFDGILCVNRQILETVREAIPQLSAERIAEVKCPIRPPASRREDENLSRPIKLGYIGRLQVPHKRVDRIPDYCDALASHGIDFRMNVIGDGPERSSLEKNNLPHAVITGSLQGEAYWRAVQSLDALVFFSDSEGTPVALIEALSQGVIPIYPKIESGGDLYVKQISPDLLYPPGDLNAAARIAKNLSERPPAYIAELRERCRQSVAEHSVAQYLRDTFDFTKRIGELPRLSTSTPGLSLRLLQFFSPTHMAKIRELFAKGKRAA
jgi:glycosyltransferase involved in cell wall biosynthesis